MTRPLARTVARAAAYAGMLSLLNANAGCSNNTSNNTSHNTAKNTARRSATNPPVSASSVGAVVPIVHTTVDAAGSALARSGQRIFIMGASVSAGMGGLTFLEAFKTAAPRGEVASAASIMLFRDPTAATQRQAVQALAFKPNLVVALDLLFWDAYGFAPQASRRVAMTAALAQLDRLHAAGAIVVVGDIPHIVTASPMLLSPEAVPSINELAELNAELAAWAGPGKWVAPFASWAAPLAKNAEVTLPDGARVVASTLMAADGLHANPLGTFYVLSLLDRWLEARGVPADDLRFVAPAR